MISSIGAGRDFSTINAWITYLQTTDFGSGAGVLTEPHVGECYGQEFHENVNISGITTTSTNKVTLTAAVGARHNGTAHAVSSGNNARIKTDAVIAALRVRIPHCEISHLEVFDTGVAEGIVVNSIGTAGEVSIHHCIVHNDRQNEVNSNYGIYVSDSNVTVKIYRNIVYGMGSYSINCANVASGSLVYNNTSYNNRLRGFSWNISNCILRNNVAFDNDENYASTIGQEYNASGSTDGTETGPASGTGSLPGLITANQFSNISGYGTLDLRLKSGSDLLNVGTDLGSPYDADIEGDSMSGSWDMGADEFTPGLIKVNKAVSDTTTHDAELGINREIAVDSSTADITTYNCIVPTIISGPTKFIVHKNNLKYISVVDDSGTKVVPTITNNPSHGTVSVMYGHLIRYIPDTDYIGADTFSYSTSVETKTITLTVSEFEPPIGIPMPSFGINEQAPARPSSWTSEVTGYYYVDSTHASATDSSNDYGYPAKPRRSIPNTLNAGDVVEFHGHHTLFEQIAANGTSSNPVFLRGQLEDMPQIGNKLYFTNVSYLIVENITSFGGWHPTVASKLEVGPNIDHLCIRNCIVGGPDDDSGGDNVIMGADNTTEVVIYNNQVYDNGNWLTGIDEDVQGIAVKGSASNVWILDNEAYRGSGEGVTLDARSLENEANMHHIYVGRNICHHNKQVGCWTKQGTDVIFSQNIMYKHLPSPSDPDGATCGFQYAPERVWYIFNTCYMGDKGIISNSGSGLGSGLYSYLIGNLIFNCTDTNGDYNPDNVWQCNGGIRLIGNYNKYIVNNTIINCDSGAVMNSTGHGEMVNNLIYDLNKSDGTHLFSSVFGDNVAHHNLVYQPGGSARIKWNSQIASSTLPSAESAHPTEIHSNVEADPLFVDENNKNYSLNANSPAIGNADSTSSVYDTFFNTYGIDIRKDINGNTRSSWDIGAFEFSSSLIELNKQDCSLTTYDAQVQNGSQIQVSVDTAANNISSYDCAVMKRCLLEVALNSIRTYSFAMPYGNQGDNASGARPGDNITFSETEESANVPDDHSSKFRNSYVNVSIPKQSGHSSTTWQFFREFDAEPHFTMTTNDNQDMDRIGNVLKSGLTFLSIALDRTLKWYVRYKVNGGTWSPKHPMQLKHRSVLGKHRDQNVIKETSRGATVSTKNPLWTEQKTKRGATIINHKT